MCDRVVKQAILQSSTGFFFFHNWLGLQYHLHLFISEQLVEGWKRKGKEEGEETEKR